MKKTLAIVAASAALLLTLTACGDKTEVNTDPEPKPAAEAPAETTAPEPEVGTRENPAPLGSEVSSDEWTITINSVLFDAATDPEFQAANEYIDLTDLPEGEQFVLANVTYTYTGTDKEGSVPAFVGIDLVTADGVTQPYDVIAFAPGEGDLSATLYEGATTTANIVRTIPTDKVEGAVLAVSPGIFGDTVFVATK